jgi:hypothetical protein
MRLARKLFLLLAMALTALAMSATTASADTPVEVHDETGTHCGDPDPCEIHVVGESLLHVTGVPTFVVSQCEDEFVAEIYEDGTGHITDLTGINHNAQACATVQCNGVGESPDEIEWEFTTEETGPEQEELQTRFCLDARDDPDAIGNHCDADVRIEEDPLVDHQYTFHLNEPCPNGLTVVGEWDIEGSPIEIEHPVE